MSSHYRRRSPVQLWRWPAAIALLTIFGLLSALLGQGGVWWVLSWVALAVPLALILYFIHMRRRPAARL
jgi:hypothetical protein